jgi:uncharacterized protein YqeY
LTKPYVVPTIQTRNSDGVANSTDRGSEMITDRLAEDMKSALKAGEKTRLGAIRMLMSELKNARIEKGEDLDEAEEKKVLASYAKKRKEAMEKAREVGREDVAAKEQEEHAITLGYLPERLGEDELKAIVQKHIESAGGGKQAFGQVMKAVLAEVGEQADGKTVSALVKEMLH